ncbi:MAG: SDR family oxidoreductase [Ilumatobacteraceae bacterium]
MARGRFEGKNAVVMAGASGIGLAITRAFVAEGGRAVVGDINTDGLADLARECGDAVVTRQASALVEDDVAGLVAQCAEELGGLDAMFNVAGGSRSPAMIMDLLLEDWAYGIDLTLTSAFLGVKHAGREMARRGQGGAIVNIASVHATQPSIPGAAYSAAKAGIVNLTATAAVELAELRIRVNCISPGVTATPPVVSRLFAIPGAEEAYIGRIPYGRAADPSEMASAVMFLASDEASYITGTNLTVDGGWAVNGSPDMRAARAGYQVPALVAK